MATLTFLHAGDNEISNISPISSLDLLETLYLENNPLDENAAVAIRNLQAQGTDVML